MSLKKDKKALIIAVLAVIMILITSLVFSGNDRIVFTAIKIESLLCSIVFAVLYGINNRHEEQKLFFICVYCLFACLFINYAVNFIAHTATKDLTSEYIWENSLRFGVLITTLTSTVAVEKKGKDLAKAFVIVGLLVGCSYMFIMTPISVPDEDYHYQSSYIVSNYLMLQDNKQEAVKSHVDYENFEKHQNVSTAYKRFNDSVFLSKDELAQKKTITKRFSVKYPIQHIPQALGITIGRLMHLDFMGIFYLGRLFNLLFYIGCGYSAIRRIPQFKLPLFVVMLLPMSIHQAASFSSDSFINGLSFVLIALIVDKIINEAPFDKRAIIEIAVVSMVMVPVKVIYILIDGLLLLIPLSSFNNQKKEKIKAIALIIISSLLLIMVFKLTTMIEMTETVSAEDSWCDESYYPLSFIMTNPIKTIKIFVDTFAISGVWYLETMIGSSLSGLSMAVPVWLVLGFSLIAVISTLRVKTEKSYVFSAKNRAYIFAICFGVCLAAMLAMFISWTPVSSNCIVGVQGRYLIPVMPLLALVLRNNVVILNRDVGKNVMVVLLLLQFGTLNSVVYQTFLSL